MAQSIPTAPDRRFDSLRDSLECQQGLPFLAHRSRARVEAACDRQGHRWRPRIDTPWISPGIFLSQVLSKDQSCDDAVDRFQALSYYVSFWLVAMIEKGLHFDLSDSA